MTDREALEIVSREWEVARRKALKASPLICTVDESGRESFRPASAEEEILCAELKAARGERNAAQDDRLAALVDRDAALKLAADLGEKVKALETAKAERGACESVSVSYEYSKTGTVVAETRSERWVRRVGPLIEPVIIAAAPRAEAPRPLPADGFIRPLVPTPADSRPRLKFRDRADEPINLSAPLVDHGSPPWSTPAAVAANMVSRSAARDRIVIRDAGIWMGAAPLPADRIRTAAEIAIERTRETATAHPFADARADRSAILQRIAHMREVGHREVERASARERRPLGRLTRARAWVTRERVAITAASAAGAVAAWYTVVAALPALVEVFR